MANVPEWIVADLALLHGRFIEVPVPLAFTGRQAQSMLDGCALLLVDEAGWRRLGWASAGIDTDVLMVNSSIRSAAVEHRSRRCFS